MKLPQPNPKGRSSKFRLFRRKEVWTLTLQGWLLVIFFLVIAQVSFFTGAYPFLAVSAPLQADLLVVDGWIPDNGLQQAIAEFRKGQYQKLVTLGSVLPQGHYLAQYPDFAEMAAATLVVLGMPENQIERVSVPLMQRDRTLNSALTLGRWLDQRYPQVNRINVFTFSTHARRSWVLFQRALSPKRQVGIIAAQPQEYDPRQWWRSSEGVRSVLSEAIAYLYVILLQR
ncbi:MAG: cytosine deaminase [Oculatellaceae cyanobacterium Prado106]|jgi:hypothetical protein|nr:cytosine deaminase [Oculatellaceae cyanobacterium Prado106]